MRLLTKFDVQCSSSPWTFQNGAWWIVIDTDFLLSSRLNRSLFIYSASCCHSGPQESQSSLYFRWLNLGLSRRFFVSTPIVKSFRRHQFVGAGDILLSIILWLRESHSLRISAPACIEFLRNFSRSSSATYLQSKYLTGINKEHGLIKIGLHKFPIATALLHCRTQGGVDAAVI